MDDKQSYLPLNGRTVCSYSICYKINEDVQLDDSLLLSTKKDLIVRSFSSLNKQRNLIFVDMIFPNILADIVLEVFINNIHTLADYIILPKTYRIVDEKYDTLFFNDKLREFVKMLLFSDIQEEKLSSGTIYSDRTYTLIDAQGILQFYNIDNYPALVEIMLNKIQLIADKKNASMIDAELCIKLDMKVL
jgi:hypothetical protein